MKQEIDFKKRIHKLIRKIPRGKVLTYQKIAELAIHPKAWRAVGNILNKNRNPKIPCHRVVCSDGRVGGYNKGEKKKALLLEKEGVRIKNGKIEKKWF